MKKFITIHEKTSNVQLNKDVGQIAYQMHKIFGFDSRVVLHKTNEEYPAIQNEVSGLKLDFVPKIRLGTYSLSVVYYILKNSSKITVLNCFYHKNKSYFYLWLYKTLNPNGVAYLKSDKNHFGLKKDDGFFPTKESAKLRHKIRNLFFKSFMKKVDLVSVETKEGYEFIVKKYPQHAKKFIHITNGADLDYIHSRVTIKTPLEKENIIITVGRIGTEQKNSEMMLEVLKNIDLKGWRFYFIGPIEREFTKKIDSFFFENPHLRESVIFTGNISSKDELYMYYNRAKVFALTSIEEGFALVFPEAIAFGNYIITTDVSGADDITNGGKFGSVIEQNRADLFAKSLQNIIDNKKIYEDSYDNIINFSNENFDWKKIITKLAAALH